MINVTQTFLPPLEEYTELLARVWDSKWLTNRGELVRELEQELRQYLGVSDLLIVNNGTMAIQLAIKGLEIGGEIITTPFSYVATVSSIVWENLTPVFVDIDPAHLTIDEAKIEAAITENTSAILATHVYGNPCNVEVIDEIARRNGLRVIYDAAHCFGVKYRGRSILNWGDVSTLSFHATKLFHTGEGGAIICPDSELAHKIFYHHNFGHNGPEEFFGLGVNGKISELNAAMGLSVLPHMSEILERRRGVCELYDDLLSGTSLTRVTIRAETEWNYSYYPVIFPNEQLLRETMSALSVRDIFARRYFYPALNQLPYVPRQEMPIAEDISRRVLCLPLAAGLASTEIKQVADVICQHV